MTGRSHLLGASKKPWFGMPLFSWHRGQFTGYSPIRPYIESMTHLPDAPRMSNAQSEATSTTAAHMAEIRSTRSLPPTPEA